MINGNFHWIDNDKIPLQIFTAKLQPLVALHFPLLFQCDYHMKQHRKWQSITYIDEYSYGMSTAFWCNCNSQITVANVTLPKAVLSTVEIFVVYKCVHWLDTLSVQPKIVFKNKDNKNKRTVDWIYFTYSNLATIEVVEVVWCTPMPRCHPYLTYLLVTRGLITTRQSVEGKVPR